MQLELIIFVTALATYFWRFVGIVGGRHLTPESVVFRAFSCVTYAMIAALALQMGIFPQSSLQNAPVALRVFALAVALVLFFSLRKSVALSAWISCGMFFILLKMFSE